MTDDTAREHLLTFIGTTTGQLVRAGASSPPGGPPPAMVDPAAAIRLVLAGHLVELRRNDVIDDAGYAAVAGAVQAVAVGNGGTSAEDLEARLDAHVPDSLKGAATLGLAREEWLATAGRLAWRDASLLVQDRVLALSEAVQTLAEAHVVTVMPAYLAGRPVQPTTLAHFLGALIGPLATARHRFQESFARLNRSPLGSGLMAGDVLAADREDLASRLGFAAPMPNTLDALGAVEDLVELLDATAAALAPVTRFLREVAAWVRTDPTSFVIDDAWTAHPEPAQPALTIAARLDDLQRRLRSTLDQADGVRRELRNQEYGPLGASHAWVLDQATTLATPVTAALDEAVEFMVRGLIVNRAYLGNRAGRGYSTAGDLATFLMSEEQVPPVAARRIASLVLSRLRDANLEVSGITQDMIDSAALMIIGQEIKVEIEALGRYLAPRRFLERRQVSGSPAPAMTRAWLAAARHALEDDRGWLAVTRASIESAIHRLETEIASAAAENLES